MTSQDHPNNDSLDQILYNSEAVQPRLQGIAEQILMPDHAEVEVRRQDGGKVGWLISKGHGYVDGREVRLAERLPKGLGRKKLKDLDYAMSSPMLIDGKNTRAVLAYIQGGIVVNNDSSLRLFGSEDEVYKRTEQLLSEILQSSQGIAAAERQERAQKRSQRFRRAGRTLTALAVAGGLLWQGPDIVNEADEWRQHEIAKQDADRARSQANKAAARQAEADRIATFDREHPRLKIRATLKDGVKIPVPFTEEFDGISVPAGDGKTLSSNIRSYPLPESGKCTSPLELDIPEGHSVEAARTGDPREIIFAEQDSVSNTIRICDANLDKTNTVQYGHIFLSLALKLSN